MKKIVAIVPMKLNNQRLPQKNTKAFTNGKPLCYYILSTLLKIEKIDEVYVYCSNEEIKKYIPSGVKYLKRSESLDQNTTKMNEVLKAFAKDVPADVYVMTHTTAPFISKESIEKGLDAVLSGEYDSSFAAKKLQDFLWKDGKPFNYELDNIPRTQDLEPLYEETSGFYIYNSSVITSLNGRIGEKPYIVEVNEIEEVDYVILDMEHGPVTIENQQNNIRAAEARNTVPIIRLKDRGENTIGKALDIGAYGIQVPQINNAEEAKNVVKFAKFYPYGMRGVCRFVRAADYSNCDRYKFFESSKDVLIILQLEGIKAIENLDEILDVEGVDILFIGPYDLSQSLGIPGQVNNPVVVNAMKDIVERAKAKGKVVGTFVDTPQDLKMWKEIGVQYLSYSVDVGIFIDACKQLRKSFE